MSLKYQKGFVYEGNTFVVNKSDIHNAKDEQFVEGTALLPIEEPKPLTLEELQELIDSDEEDSAIWVKDIEYDHFTRALLDWDRDRGIFAIWHGDKDTSDFPIEKDYGKTWLAYRTKPEGSGEE